MLSFKFWDRHPTIVAAELIGCTLKVNLNGHHLSGRIVETEAYHEDEEACHAFGFQDRKKTARVAHFFGPAGVTYVYLNYGIHNLFNVITGPGETGSAVLIRAIEPVDGLETMRRNRGNVKDRDLCNGPGKLTQALGIDLTHNRIDLSKAQASIAFQSCDNWQRVAIEHGPRVGIKKATDYLWRYAEKGSPLISKAKENKLLKPFKRN
jgi:DNA-3-methyladenine glycosylase